MHKSARPKNANIYATVLVQGAAVLLLDSQSTFTPVFIAVASQHLETVEAISNRKA